MPEPTPSAHLPIMPPCEYHKGVQDAKIGSLEKTVESLKSDMNTGFNSLSAKLDNLPCINHATQLAAHSEKARTIYVVAGIIAFFIGLGVSIASIFMGK
jgi:hypothetical protein